ncbi:hypothetical protein [Thalassotalea sp. PS06]|uniref:hypothetical protein n=1 Tax=Thalassotalea sp. PS06 TaxID=2594005 RepID=UPI001163D3DC|nr:hypothetical protein [Thalassotalea sp. PS06]QDP00688.1 hypothetical protein FNC98_04575 [Thalassotalea sp. PS06]
MRFLLFILGLLLVVATDSVDAQDDTKVYVPESLEPWKSWVLEDYPYIDCPVINNKAYANEKNHICAFGSPLVLDLTATQGTFSQQWQLFSQTWVTLPGGKWNWPTQVTVNDKAASVIVKNQRPQLLLPAGTHQINGKFTWQQLPKQLAIDHQTPLIALTINDEQTANYRVEDGELWLAAQQTASVEANEMSIEVIRHLQDGPYLTLTTQIDIEIYGQAREESLGQVLPEGFTLTDIDSELASYVDSKGELRLKALPGDWEINLTARAKPERLSISRPESKSPWPEQEVWLFAAAPETRIARVTGLPAIDTSQVYLSDEWEQLPGYMMTPDAVMDIEVSHRGIPLQIRNELRLNRKLWLNFDGEAFTFSDSITGNMIKDWRLTMPAPYILESAQDQDGPLLVSEISAIRGIENRYPATHIEAQGQLQQLSNFDIGGWQQEFDTIQYDLQLPPGYRLFAIFGADKTSNTWIDKWNLWNSFIVLLITGLIASLYNKPLALLGLFTMVLVYHEPGSPIIAIGIALLCIALYRQLNGTRVSSLSSWLSKITLIIAALVSVYFVATQLRLVVYPQLEHRYVNQQDSYATSHFAPQQDASEILEDVARERKARATVEEVRGFEDAERIEVTGSRIKRSDLISRYQADAPIQAGSGRPDWAWNRYGARWNSPVSSGQQMTTVILNPVVYNLIRITGLILLLILFWLTLGKSSLNNSSNPSSGLQTLTRLLSSASKAKGSTSAALLLPLVMIFTSGGAGQVQAQTFPQQELLQQLQQKLLQPPACHPDCATTQWVKVSAERQHLTLDISIHAQQSVAMALPHSEQWQPQSVELNGKPAGVMIKKGAHNYLLLPAGSSNIRLLGKVFQQDTISLNFQDRPQAITHDIRDWEISGLHRGKMQNRTLELVPKADSEQTDGESFKQSIKPFVEIQRKLAFDQDWYLFTTVTRKAPAKGAINLDIPLLPGEKVYTADIVIKDDNVTLSMSADDDIVTWRSNIPRLEEFSWNNPSSESFYQHWQVLVSPSWHVQLSGVPSAIFDFEREDYYEYNFFPQDNEQLLFQVTRPAPVPGESLAIDNVTVEWQSGKRLSKLNLAFDYRATQAQQHKIFVPEGYQVSEVIVDEKRLQLQSNEQELMLPITPGEHHYQLAFSSNQGVEVSNDFPVFNLNAPISNIRNQMPLTSERWLLATSGPAVGPAVVYWGELLVFIFVALILTKANIAPLSLWQWLLLGVGISTNNWSVIVMLALTFAAIRFYQKPEDNKHWRIYNLGKLTISLFALFSMLALLAVIPMALLSAPDMGIAGNNSGSYGLNWFADRSDGETSSIWILSLPILVYKAVMLLWVMWLSFTFIGWVKWGWKRLTDDGFWMAKPVIVNPEAKAPTSK